MMRGYLDGIRALVAAAGGDDDEARVTLESALAERPLTDPVGWLAATRWLALAYVLVPAARPIIDAADLGPLHAERVAIARLVVAAREGGPIDGCTVTAATARGIATTVPLPWSMVARGSTGDRRPPARPRARRLVHRALGGRGARRVAAGGHVAGSGRPWRRTSPPRQDPVGARPHPARGARADGAGCRRSPVARARLAARAGALAAAVPRAPRAGPSGSDHRRPLARPRHGRGRPQPAGHAGVPAAGARARSGQGGGAVPRPPGRTRPGPGRITARRHRRQRVRGAPRPGRGGRPAGRAEREPRAAPHGARPMARTVPDRCRGRRMGRAQPATA